MTLLGKIFTVMIFIMAVLFMGFAIVVYATHRNWRTLVINDRVTPENPELGLNIQLRQANEKNQRLNEEMLALQEQLAFEQASRRTALASLQSKLDQVRQQLADRETRLTALETALNTAVTSENTTANTLQRVTNEVGGLREEIRTVQNDRDAQFLRVVQLTDDLHQKTGIERNLKERNDQLIAQYVDMKRVMDAFGINVNTPITDRPPDVEGEVTAVGDRHLVEISLGSDDGLRIGNTLEVFRNSTYLGRIVVKKTSPDRSVAEILRNYQRGPIKVKDSVATKLRS